MKPATAPALKRTPLARDPDEAWRERAGRLFAEFEQPAHKMVRRAFRSAFSADEIDDVYASAWAGTLRALADRHQKLSDDEVRSYVLTAVANQAGKELRRRRRKPTAPLELVRGVADDADAPDERVAEAEQSQITRDLLTSLPPRRRAVILLRYGWGLEPSQVCGLIKGLSPRAYRKEITRGVEELTAKMRAVESGDWCSEREPVLRAYVAGLVDTDGERQAQAHLAHCRDCSDFVARLQGHLHDLGSAAAAPAAIDGIDGHFSLGDRLIDLGDRARDAAGGLLARSPAGADEATAAVTASGGARGAGVAGAGVLAKVAGLGAAGKLAAACVGGSVAATACVAAGLTPLQLGIGGAEERPEQRRVDARPLVEREGDLPTPEVLPSQVSAPEPPSSSAPAATPSPAANEGATTRDAGVPAPENEPTTPIEPSTPPIQEEFGAPAAAAPPPSAPAPAPAPPADFGGGASGSTVRQEFGP